ncbi:hypothetical protein L4X33_21180 [Phocaeicola vulgatus]|nr:MULTISPECIES: hypothetical protein [Bacteria]MCG0326566.1 hypothetical protein [Phocaeicola vulgatus]
MAKFIAVFVACFALAAGGLVRRDAPGNPLEDLQKHASEFQKTFSEQLNQLVNSKNTQEVNKVLKDGSESVLQQVSTLSSALQSVLQDANGKAKEALQQTRDNLEKTVSQLRKDHPEVEQQATVLRDKLQTAVNNAVQETKKLANTVAANVEETNKKLEPKIKAAYDDFVKHAEQVQKQLHEAANKQ